MKVKQPSYYPGFQCRAGSCQDSCCIGWEIPLDSETASHYRVMEGPLGDRIRESMQESEDQETSFRCGPDQRCPLLNPDGLCELICTLGEESLSEVCREHPRFHQWYPGFREDGLGLCCEEAARLLLSREEPLDFILTEEPEDSGRELSFSPERARLLWAARKTGLRILQNRRYSVWDRLAMLVSFGAMLEDFLPEAECEDGQGCAALYADAEELVQEYAPRNGQVELYEIVGQLASDWTPKGQKEKQRMTGQLLDLFLGLEFNRPGWMERLKGLRSNPARLVGSWEKLRREEEGTVYEQLAVYFFDRYFLDSCWYWDSPMRGVFFSVLSVLMLSLLDAGTRLEKGTVSLEDRIEAAKNYSREVEYSLENMDLLDEWRIEQGLLLSDRFIWMLASGERGGRFS